MADELRPWKPSRPALVKFAEILRRGMGGAEELLPESRYAYDLLGLPAVATTAERLGYGDRLTKGRGQTLQMLPETAEAAMFGLDVAPLARAGARIVSRGALRASDAATRAITGNPQATAMRVIEEARLPTPAAVIKPKGGNWLAGTVESKLEPLKKSVVSDPDRIREYLEIARAEMPSEVPWYEQMLAQSERGSAVNEWLDKKLARYIRNEMATEQDPLRELARRGISATPEGDLRRASEYTPEKLQNARQELGYPKFGVETSDPVGGLYNLGARLEDPAVARAAGWERIADEAMGIYDAENAYVADLLKRYPETSIAGQNLREANPWITKPMPASTKVYGEGLYLTPETGFRHLSDELYNATNPESGLPPELLWKYSDLSKVSVPQAVERVAKINEWRAAQKVLADAAKARNPATHVFKEYPEQGYSWVELKTPGMPEGWAPPDNYEIVRPTPGAETLAIRDKSTGKYVTTGLESEEQAIKHLHQMTSRSSLEDALKYEGDTMGHCVGGYCPDVESGRSRIFSLRDKKGQPHVTIEVSPGKDKSGLLSDEDLPPSVREDLERRNLLDPSYMWRMDETLGRYVPEVGPFEPSIVQIKGKANRAPNPEYLPAVQDFVRSQKWGSVRDLENAGLRFIDTESDLGVKLREAGVDVSPYVNEAELTDLLDRYGRTTPPSPSAGGFASGGLVSADYDPARVASLADDLLREMQLV